MARKTREDTLKTVQAILDAAEIVFIEHGVAKSTIGHIAEAAGASKGAVYGHFKNKIEICIAVCERGLNGLQEKLQPSRANAENPLEALYQVGVDYVRFFFDSASLRHTGEILYSKCENSAEFSRIQEIRQLWERNAFKLTAKLIRKAVIAGDLPENLDECLGNIYLHSVIDGLICSFYYTDRLPSRDQMKTVEQVLNLAIAGLGRATKQGN